MLTAVRELAALRHPAEGREPKTELGRCKAKAHRRDTLGLPGRRVLVSRKWSGKSLADQKADRAEFVREALAAVGIEKRKPDPSRLILRAVRPGDPNVPPQSQLLMHAKLAAFGDAVKLPKTIIVKH